MDESPTATDEAHRSLTCHQVSREISLTVCVVLDFCLELGTKWVAYLPAELVKEGRLGEFIHIVISDHLAAPVAAVILVAIELCLQA